MLRRKLLPGLLIAFGLIVLIRSPEAAGDLTATIGTMFGVLVDEMTDIALDLFR